MTRKFLCAALCWACGSTAVAAADGVFELPEFHVYAVRLSQVAEVGAKTPTSLEQIPAAVTIVNADEVERLGAYRLTDALEYNSGLVVASRGYDEMYPFLKIRGLNVANTNILVDGRKVFAGTDKLFSPEMYGLESVEVYRGPASVVYGQGSISGVVNLRQKRPTGKREVALRAQLGAKNQKSLALDVNGVHGENSFSRNVFLFDKTNGWYDQSTHERRYWAPSWTKKWQRDELTIAYNYQWDKIRGSNYLPKVKLADHPLYGVIPDRFNIGDPKKDYYRSQQQSWNYRWTHHWQNNWEFHQQATYRKSGIRLHQVNGMYDPREKEFRRFVSEADNQAKAYDVDQFFVYHRDTVRGDQDTTIGWDWHLERSTNFSKIGMAQGISLANLPAWVAAGGGLAGNIFWLGDGETDRYQYKEQGWYLTHRQTIGPWTWNVGLRRGSYRIHADRDEISDFSQQAWTGDIGVVYRIGTDWYPYLHWHNSFQAAADFDKNKKLLPPTTGREWEWGVRYYPEGKNIQVRASVYDLRMQNIHRPVMDPKETYFINTGEIASRGAELEWRVGLAERMHLLGSYSYNHAKVTKDTNPLRVGRRLTGAPTHTLAWRVDWAARKYEDGDLTLGIGMRYLGRRVADLPDRRILGGTMVWDASLSYVRGDNSWSLYGRNIFGKKYIVGAEESWQSPEGFAGQDRTWVLSYMHKW